MAVFHYLRGEIQPFRKQNVEFLSSFKLLTLYCLSLTLIGFYEALHSLTIFDLYFTIMIHNKEL